MILDFAREFDPLPFHLDEAAAKASLLGGLASSGWQTAALTLRLLVDSFLNHIASMGGLGFSDLKWKKPGDGRRQHWRHGHHCRPPPLAQPPRARHRHPRFRHPQSEGRAGDDHAPRQSRRTARSRRRRSRPPSDPLVRGHHRRRALPPRRATSSPKPRSSASAGSTTRNISTSIRRPPSTRPFGGLVASGWHTVSVGHRHMVDALFAEEERLRALGSEPGVSGPSPGVNSMEFKVPVRPGDTRHLHPHRHRQASLQLAAGLGPAVQHHRGHQPARRTGLSRRPGRLLETTGLHMPLRLQDADGVDPTPCFGEIAFPHRMISCAPSLFAPLPRRPRDARFRPGRRAAARDAR